MGLVNIHVFQVQGKWSMNTDFHGVKRDFAMCVRCPHGKKTDSFDSLEVRIHGPFSLQRLREYIQSLVVRELIYGIGQKKCNICLLHFGTML